MEHEPQLSDEERRIFAEIEQGLRRRTRRRVRRLWWTGVVVGIGLLAGGLIGGAVWVAALGFIAVLVSLFVLTSEVGPATVAERVRRLTGRGPDGGDGGDRP